MTWLQKIKTIAQTRTLRDVLFVYGGALTNGAALFLLNIVLARALTKDAFGAFSLSVLVLGTVAEMSDFGLNAGFLRFAPYYIERHEGSKLLQLVKTVWNWRVSLSAILTIGGVALADVIARYVLKQPSITELVRFSFVGIGGVILLGFVSTYLQASQSFVRSSMLQAAKGLLRLIPMAILVLLHVDNLYLLLAIYLGVPWLLLVFNFSVLPRGFTRAHIEPEIKSKLHSQLARFSFWLTIWSLSAIISSRIDQIMISNYLDLGQVATYAVAFQFVFVYSLALQSISTVLTPKISQLGSKEVLWDYCKKIFRWTIPVTVLIAVAIYPSQYIVELFFGKKYASAMPLYLFLSYSMLINFLATPVSFIITVFNRTELVAFAGFLQLIINVVCNLILIPRYGLMGAAATFCIGIIVSQLYNAGVSAYLFSRAQVRVL